MLVHELRKKYVEFFVGKEHLAVPSAPLVPIDHLGVEDTTTLFTSAGMQQFKPYFVGAANPPKRRMVTVQKCLRTVDIDSVGDFSHCTFFEMLGNFSFGDYFKADVIPWTWEFLTEWLGLDADRICCTVYSEDQEAFDIWHDIVGMPVDRIHRLGEDKNYWPANAISQGPNGPCGPCTEIFYRVAPVAEMTSGAGLTPTDCYKIDDDAGRWLEIWNNVFTQFDRQENADAQPVLRPLPHKNNDTGAGLERIAGVLQGKTSVFDNDTFAPVIARIEELAGRRYGHSASKEDLAFRVIAEHARATVFCLADGILPSNEGRGYVLRRIMRRAIRYGKGVLGFSRPFLNEVAPEVIAQMGVGYPELVARQEHILRSIEAEEERFRRTIDHGTDRLTEILDSGEVTQSHTVSGTDAFTLYDTFGFPLELTREIAAERGVSVDTAGFEAAMDEQRRRSQEAGSMTNVFEKANGVLLELQKAAPPTAFVGYGALTADTTVAAIVLDGALVAEAPVGAEVEVALAQTPFYAESGGQVGDTGVLAGASASVEVVDTRKSGGITLHAGTVAVGVLRVGDTVTARVSALRRDTARNHTATHLLQAALREVLGSHVHQKGSFVAPDRLRFDFTHTQPVTDEELRQVEEIANRGILEDHLVDIAENVPIAEARARGAMALFGEKYGDRVRVVNIEGVSVELCGGTHVTRTSQIGLLKVISEGGVAAGVRRIEAVTGQGVYQWIRSAEDTQTALAGVLRTSPRDVLTAAEKLVAQRAALEKQVQQLRTAGGAPAGVDTAAIGSVSLAYGFLGEADAETLAARADQLLSKTPNGIVALSAAYGGKALFVVKASQEAVQAGVHAGRLVKAIAKHASGGGGGRDDFAQAGGRDGSKAEEAVRTAADAVRQMLHVPND